MTPAILVMFLSCLHQLFNKQHFGTHSQQLEPCSSCHTKRANICVNVAKSLTMPERCTGLHLHDLPAISCPHHHKSCFLPQQYCQCSRAAGTAAITYRSAQFKAHNQSHVHPATRNKAAAPEALSGWRDASVCIFWTFLQTADPILQVVLCSSAILSMFSSCLHGFYIK
jgi:hypothetical protein